MRLLGGNKKMKIKNFVKLKWNNYHVKKKTLNRIDPVIS